MQTRPLSSAGQVIYCLTLSVWRWGGKKGMDGVE